MLLRGEAPMSKRPSVHYADTLAFRVPRVVGDRLRDEAKRGNAALADVAREYLAAGMRAADAERQADDAPGKRGRR